MGLDRDLLRLASVVVLATIRSILDTTIVNVATVTLGRRGRCADEETARATLGLRVVS